MSKLSIFAIVFLIAYVVAVPFDDHELVEGNESSLIDVEGKKCTAMIFKNLKKCNKDCNKYCVKKECGDFGECEKAKDKKKNSKYLCRCNGSAKTTTPSPQTTTTEQPPELNEAFANAKYGDAQIAEK